MNKTVAIIFIAFCVGIICCGIWVLGTMLDVNGFDFKKNKDNVSETEDTGFKFSENIDFAIVVEKKTSSIVVKELATGIEDEILVNNDAIITGSNGGKIFFSDITKGSLVHIELDSIGRADEIRFPEEAWHYTSVSGAEINSALKLAVIDDKEYEYTNDTIFSYKGNDINPSDIDKNDIVSVYGKDGNILSIVVERYHGNIVLINTEKVEDLGIKIDYSDVENTYDFKYSVACGKHSVVITGSNIDIYVTEVLVEEGSDTVIDISKVANAVKLMINVNIDDYKLFVNDTPYPDGTNEIFVDKGVYDIRIESEGYTTYRTVIDCTKKGLQLNVRMEKDDIETDVSGPPKTELNSGTGQNGNLTIYTDPGWAKVYIDGEYVGVSPVMVKLDYGEYNIKAKDSDGNISEGSVSISVPETTIKLDF